MRTRTSGASLIEVLVVIVVFLVGILAVIQIFPVGLTILRTTRNNTMSAALARAEMQRLIAKDAQIAEIIAPVSYQVTGSGVRTVIDGRRSIQNLMPPKDPDPNPGLIDRQGNVFVNGENIGHWMRVSGANTVSRVIGEGHPIPAPRQVGGGQFGGVLQLQFAPIYYFADAGTGIGEPGILSVYGNDLARRRGDRVEGLPEETADPREYEFFYVPADLTATTEPFLSEDQIWLGVDGLRDYRFTFSFKYQNGATVDQYEMIATVTLDPGAPPAWAAILGNYWVISLERLVAEPDIYGRSLYSAANFISTERDTIRVQRMFSEIPQATAFDPANPYQYKILSPDMGAILMNPVASSTQIRTSQDTRSPLAARVDYTVYDWRIIRDEFRVPRDAPYGVKLSLNTVKPASFLNPDGLQNPGLGLLTPGVPQNVGDAIVPASQDFVVIDVETGGVLLGNRPELPLNGYTVDKSTGFVKFIDVDNLIDLPSGNGLSAYISYPLGVSGGSMQWSNATLIPDIRGRNLRAHYMGAGEWAVQAYKAASNYRVTAVVNANGLQSAECYVGGSGGIGQDTRVYFPISDLGQKVIVGELWTVDGGTLRLFEDEDFLISGVERIGGTDLSYFDIRDKAGAGAVFDFSNGYAARRVRGASVKVRVMWNPAFFFLTDDQEANYRNLESWMQSYRRIETESFHAGGTR